MFTKDELAQLKDLLKTQREEITEDIINRIVGYSNSTFTTKAEFQELKDQIKLLPTKEEFFSKMDQILGEYQNFSTDAPNLTKTVSDHEDRISLIESKLNLSL